MDIELVDSARQCESGKLLDELPSPVLCENGHEKSTFSDKCIENQELQRQNSTVASVLYPVRDASKVNVSNRIEREELIFKSGGCDPTVPMLEATLEKVGAFGLYQKLLCLFLWLLVSPFLATIIYGNMLIFLTPEHWCNLKELESYPLSAEQRKALAIPKREVKGVYRYSQCERFALNFSEAALTEVNDTVTRSSDLLRPTVTCRDGWEYDYSLIYPNIVSELHWVCDQAWKLYFAHTVFWTGSGFGVILSGILADSWGRVPVIIGGHLLCALSGLATNYVQDFHLFLIVRFLVGFAVIAQSMTAYVLVMEYVGPKQRLIVSAGYLTAYPLVGCILPWVAYYMKDWRMLNLLCTLPLLSVVLFARLIPESLRWLHTTNQISKAMVILRKIAKFNGKGNCPSLTLPVQSCLEGKEKMVSFYSLLKYPHLRTAFLLTNFVWFSLSLCFTGGFIYAATITDNPFLSITLNSLLDFLGNLLVSYFADKYGRKSTTVISLLLASACFITAGALPKTSSTAEFPLLIVARFTLTCGYNIHYLYAAEIYPTVIRGRAMAIRIAIGSVGNFISPLVVFLGHLEKWIPLSFFGAVSATSAISTCLLPETLSKNLPETLEEGEELTKRIRPFLSPSSVLRS